jgi:hypothetical protein
VTKKSSLTDITAEIKAATKALAPAVDKLRQLISSSAPEDLPVGQLADLLYDLRQIAKLPKSLNDPFEDLLDPFTKSVEDHFIRTLAVGESSGVQGLRSRVQITEKIVPTVDDWSVLYKYIKRTGSFELLNRAVNAAAVSERWKLKKKVPGVGTFHAKKVSCTKLSGKGGS